MSVKILRSSYNIVYRGGIWQMRSDAELKRAYSQPYCWYSHPPEGYLENYQREKLLARIIVYGLEDNRGRQRAGPYIRQTKQWDAP